MKTLTIIFCIIDCILIVYGLILVNTVWAKRSKLEVTTELGTEIPSWLYLFPILIGIDIVLATITVIVGFSLFHLAGFPAHLQFICIYKERVYDLAPIYSLLMLVICILVCRKHFKLILKNPSS